MGEKCEKSYEKTKRQIVSWCEEMKRWERREAFDDDKSNKKMRMILIL